MAFPMPDTSTIEESPDLYLAVNGVYFDQIANGSKREEYRLTKPYWRKRLEGRRYKNVVLTRGYPKRGDSSRTIVLPYVGYEIRTLTHPHFGASPVEVFAIKVDRLSSLRALQGSMG